MTSGTSGGGLVVHLIGNAHLDPVWLWDWREGLNQGLITCRTVLDLMDETPGLTFNRGECAVYEHIEKTDPATFARIKKYVKAGRWDVIGGTFIQPDDNLPATETFARQYARGLTYFADRFGKRVRAAWSADCFGHSAGMPGVLAAAGMKYFAFTRPDPGQMALAKQAFWWTGAGGAKVLAYRPAFGWYGSEREELPKRLDGILESAKKDGLKTAACFYGLGDHGGGPTRRQLADIAAWAKAHPEVKVMQSTLHGFFGALEREVASHGKRYLPVVEGELNFVFRGCYSSMTKFKGLYRKAEAGLLAAERTDAAISVAVGKKAGKLGRAWDAMLFNAFHDILPGTSIERAFEEQTGQVQAVIATALAGQYAAINALAMAVDTRVVPLAKGSDMPTGVAALVWNPHARPFEGFVEVEVCMDDRLLFGYQDAKAETVPVKVLDHKKQAVGFQLVAVENRFALHIPWRKRAVVPMSVPAMGWSVVEMAWVEGAPAPMGPAKGMETSAEEREGMGAIGNGAYRVEATVGSGGVKIWKDGAEFLGGEGLGAVVYEDHYGSWGGGENDAEAINISKVREAWKVTEVKVLEKGPWRSALWVRLAGVKSRIDLTFQLYAGKAAVEVSARTLWSERSAQLKLHFGVPAAEGEFDVMGATVRRGFKGDVGGGRWVRVLDESGKGTLGFASDSLYSFNVSAAGLSVIAVRSTRFSESIAMGPEAEPWVPATDMGEMKFKFVLAGGDKGIVGLAEELEQPVLAQVVPAKAGAMKTRGSLVQVEPASVKLLALKKAETGGDWIVRVQEMSGRGVVPRVKILGKVVKLGRLEGNRIGTYRVKKTKGGFAATVTDVGEGAR